MQQVVRSSSGGRRRLTVGIIVGLVCGAAVMANATMASASTTVAKFVYSPNPIGTPATVPTNHVVTISLAVEDSNGTPIPHGQVYLGFNQASGGGTASASGIPLAARPGPFFADTTGHVSINYLTPPSYPASGCDAIHAQDQSKFSTSKVKKDDSFCFSPITSIGFTPKPIASAHHLAGGTQVTVTVTVFSTGGAVFANGSVWLSFRAATGGGTATVSGTPLTKTPTAFTTNSLGEIFIVYTTQATLPPTGTDRLNGADGARFPAVFATDAYKY